MLYQSATPDEADANETKTLITRLREIAPEGNVVIVDGGPRDKTWLVVEVPGHVDPDDTSDTGAKLRRETLADSLARVHSFGARNPRERTL